MSNYDLAVAYRIYPKVAECARGLPFSDKKFRQSEICLRSFRESLGGLRVKCWALLDGCPDEYVDLFRKYFDPQDLVLIPLPQVGFRATFAKQIQVLLGQEDSDFVYFAEDDYFYLPGQFHCLLDFLREHEDAHFVSPYDHLDCYTMDLHRRPKWLRVHGGRHWRTAASTCLTFLTRRETLRKTQAVLRAYKRRSSGCSMWLSLTKSRVFNPFFFSRHLVREPFSCKIILKSWLYFWRQVLFGRRWTLWVPLPGIATHLDSHALSPTIDWSTLIKEKAEEIEIENTRRCIDSYAHVGTPQTEVGHLPPTAPLLSILVLTHNDSNKFLDGCLRSIAEKVSCPYEIILVDNGSPENDCAEFAGQYPWIRLIRSEKNLGFNAGNNLAARWARGKYLLLLNVDTILLTDVAPAVRLLESNHHIGVVGAQAYSPSHQVLFSAGRFPRAWRLWLFRSLFLRPRVRYGPEESHTYKVDWVEGSFLMTSAENWGGVGGFEEQNPLYGNDVDFCKSTLARGLAAVQCVDVKYIHYGGFGVSRMKYLYAAFRRYHEKFSGRTEQCAANLVLRAGLIARILVYGFWRRLTKNQQIEEKFFRFIDVHRTWAEKIP